MSPSPARRDPVEDLRRIAFLLERTLESSYRVKAFRTAAAALAALPADDVALLASTGGLRGIKGIGDRTAAVVEQAVAGEEPEYLASLEAAAGAPLTAGDGSALRTALRGDLHLHSDWSDGGSPIDEMARTAAELGHAYAALTDHSPRLTVARGLTPDRLRRQLEVVRDVGASLVPFRLLSGIEVDVLSDGGLDQEDELLEELDVVVASVHSELRMPADAMTRRMLAAIANPHTDVLGHCTGRYVVDREFLSGRSGQTRSGKARPESQFDAERVFAACAEAGVAVTNTPGVLDAAVADLTWALILAARRRVVEGDRIVRAREWTWQWASGFLADELGGSTLGIVGFGRIGQAVARRAAGFDMRVVYAARHEHETQLAEYRPLDALLRESGVVTLRVPSTPETRPLLDARRLALLRDGACLVNTARGDVVDEEALVRELVSGRISAGLDVFAREPHVPEPLLALPNVVLTPHVGSATEQTRAAMTRLVVDNVLAAARGEALVTPVVP